MSSSAVSDDIKALYEKWMERFSRLGAMFIAKTITCTASQPSFQQISVPVSPKKYSPVCILTSNRLFLQPAEPANQISSQPVAGPSEMPVVQPTAPVIQYTISEKPATSVAVMFINTL